MIETRELELSPIRTESGSSDTIVPPLPSTAPKCIDLFAGAGGFSLGAIQAGVNVIGALEINKKAADTYALNISKFAGKTVPIINADILPLEPEDALAKWGVAAGECDIIIGGPPCQGFSSHRINNQGVGDPRNELLSRYFDYVKKIRPRVFLVENVPGLLWPRHADYLENFYSMGENADYELYPPVVLNACDYGVPQNRKRVFILGIDKKRPFSITWPPCPTHVAPNTPDHIRNGRPFWLNASEVFGKAPLEDPNDKHMNHTEVLIELFKKTPINGGSRSDSGRVLKCHSGHGGHNDVYGRINPLKPGPTMTTACINPSKGRFVHPTENHGITLRQAARFQTFPDNFIFSGGLMAAGEQIGNAVPILLGQAIIEKISQALVQAS